MITLFLFQMVFGYADCIKTLEETNKSLHAINQHLLPGYFKALYTRKSEVASELLDGLTTAGEGLKSLDMPTFLEAARKGFGVMNRILEGEHAVSIGNTSAIRPIDELITFETTAQGHLKIYDWHGSLFDQDLSVFKTPTQFDDLLIEPQAGARWLITYCPTEESFIQFIVDTQGHITLTGSGQTQDESFSFKTPGTFTAATPVFMENLEVNADTVINNNILGVKRWQFLFKKFYNCGVIDSFNESQEEIQLYYSKLLNPVDLDPAAIIQNNGAFLDDTLWLRNLRLTNYGVLQVGRINAHNSSIFNHQLQVVSADISGNVNRLENHGHMDIASTPCCIGRFDNHTTVFLRNQGPNTLRCQAFNNDGYIFAKGYLRIESPKVAKLGIVSCDSILDLELPELLDDDHIKRILQEAELFSRMEKVILTMRHQTHHYLNTITTWRDRYGNFVKSTQTGPVFQKRTTQIKKQEKEIPAPPIRLQLMQQAADAKGRSFKALQDALRAQMQKKGAKVIQERLNQHLKANSISQL